MKNLILTRHAKSDWSNLHLTDFERELNKRGLSDAQNMGFRLLKRYIKIDQIIPTEFKLNININKDKLKESTEFSQEILSEKQPIIFDITKEFKVSGTGKDKEFSEIIHNDLNIAESDYMKIGYNPKYLIDVFKTLPDDRIKLSFVGGANKPMIITGNKTNNETYMVLPVRIAS